jgi:biopolymer transport protein ExbB
MKKNQASILSPHISIVALLLAIALVTSLPDIASALAQSGEPVATTQVDSESAQPPSGINLFSLLVRGGWFMIPLLGLSLMGAGICIERAISLRTDRILPERLVSRLARLGQQAGGLDPRDAYMVCQSVPSTASDVLRSVLVKVGRPHMELEHACTESAQRAAIRLQQPVSWLNVCAAVAPLIGLLGTVWGITQAFYDTTQLDVGQNRADALSQGIYIALVTTIAGLSIAIPATIASHFFESRIVILLNRVEEMVRGLLPQLERYEGTVRFSQDSANGESAPIATGNSTHHGAASSFPATEIPEDHINGDGDEVDKSTSSNGSTSAPIPRPARSSSSRQKPN